MSCGSRPDSSSSTYQSFDEAGYNQAMARFNERYDVQAVRAELKEQQELLESHKKALAEFEELERFDGRFVAEIQQEVISKIVNLLDEGVAAVAEDAPEQISQEATGVIGFTRGSTYALNSYAISNLMYARNNVFNEGVGGIMQELTNSVMAREQATIQANAAVAYSNLAQRIDTQDRINNIFSAIGFVTGAVIGTAVAPGVGTAAGASLGRQAGSFLGSIF